MTTPERGIAWSDEVIRASRLDTVHDHAGEPDIDRLVELVEPHGDDIVFDFVTGLGHVARAIAPHVDKVHAYDPDAELLKEAEKLTEASNLKNITFVNGTLIDLKLPDKSYDIITARLAIRHLLDASGLLKQAFRILKPSGRLVLSDTLAPSQSDLADFQANLMELRDPSHVQSYAISEFEIIFEREKFDIDVIEIYPMAYDFESWAKRLGASNENVRMLARTLQNAGDRVKRHFRVVEQGGKLISFVTWMIMIVASPAPER